MKAGWWNINLSGLKLGGGSENIRAARRRSINRGRNSG
jgi:hypothetical protein